MSEVQINIASDGSRLAPEILGLLQRLEIRESDSEPTVASLRFGMAQRSDGRWRPVDDEVFTPATSLELDVVAPGGLPTRLFSGFVTHLRPHFESIAANCYLEILAMDHAALMDAHERAVSYPDMSDSDAVGEILARYQLQGELSDTPVHYELERELLVQRGSDWSFVVKLARRNGYAFYLEHDDRRGEVVAYFGPARLDDTPQADVVILQDGANLRWADVQFRMTGPTRQIGAAIDVIDKRIIRGDGETEAATLGSESAIEQVASALASRGIDDASALIRDPAWADAGLAAQTQAASDEIGQALELQGEIDPAAYRGLLRARRPVLARGFGELLSGVYFVRVVRTVVDDGALTQTFVATRNALAQRGDEDFGQSAEEVPPQ